MKILITGSQGYLARNLSKKLNTFGFACYGIGRGKWKGNVYKKWGYYKNISGTINENNLQKYKKLKFKYIIHCAGGVSPNTSLVKSISKKKDYEKNVSSICSVLNYFALKNNKPKILFISTISVYGNTKLKKIKEENILHPISNYSINKVIAENICKDFYKNFNFDVLILRGASLYGPGLRRQMIHDVCLKISKKKNIFFGTGKEIRDFIHINDFTELIKRIIIKGFNGYLIVNAGSGNGIKIADVIYYIIKKLKKNIKPKFNNFGAKINPISLVPSIAKARKFNWSPKVNFYKGLNEYINWLFND
tara:strand:+ start:172 stop:1089 length:918 start_codon:yes stop_codon:yes gene_type:complete